MDHVRLAEVLQVTEENFETIKSCIEKGEDPKLCVLVQPNTFCFSLYDQGH